MKLFMESPNVIIIGAGPVGAYTAGKLGRAGLSVAVFESHEQLQIRDEIGFIHFEQRYYNLFGFPRPTEESGVLKGTFLDLWQVPLTESKRFAVRYPTDIIAMSGFIEGITKWAERLLQCSFIIMQLIYHR